MVNHTEEKPRMIETGDNPKEIGESKIPEEMKEEEVMDVSTTTGEKIVDPTETGIPEVTPETDAVTADPETNNILNLKLKMNLGIGKTHQEMMRCQEGILGKVLLTSMLDCALEKK